MAKRLVYFILSFFVTSLVILSGVTSASAPRWWHRDTDGRDILSYGGEFRVDGVNYIVQLDLVGHGHKRVRYLTITSLDGRLPFLTSVEHNADRDGGRWETMRICTPKDLREFGLCEDRWPTHTDLLIVDVLGEQVEQDQYAFANWDDLWEFEMKGKHIREELANRAQ